MRVAQAAFACLCAARGRQLPPATEPSAAPPGRAAALARWRLWVLACAPAAAGDAAIRRPREELARTSRVCSIAAGSAWSLLGALSCSLPAGFAAAVAGRRAWPAGRRPRWLRGRRCSFDPRHWRWTPITGLGRRAARAAGDPAGAGAGHAGHALVRRGFQLLLALLLALLPGAALAPPGAAASAPAPAREVVVEPSAEEKIAHAREWMITQPAGRHGERRPKATWNGSPTVA